MKYIYFVSYQTFGKLGEPIIGCTEVEMDSLITKMEHIKEISDGLKSVEKYKYNPTIINYQLLRTEE